MTVPLARSAGEMSAVRTAQSFRHAPTQPRRRLRFLTLIGYAGPLGCVLLLGKLHAAYFGHYDFSGSARFSWSCVYVGLLWLAIYSSGMPTELAGRSPLVAVMGATVGAAIGVSALQLVVGSALLPRFVVFGATLLLIPTLWAWVVAGTKREEADQRERVRVVAVLVPSELATVQREIDRSHGAGLLLTTIIWPNDPQSPTSDLRVFDTAIDARASVVVLNRQAQVDDAILRQAADLHAVGIRVRDLRQFYEENFGKVPLTELAQGSLLFDIPELHSRGYVRGKRILDLAAGLTVLPAFVVSMPIVALANLVGNRGPLFFTQTRVGKNGRTFEMLKFRSMKPGPTPGEWTSRGDPRLTGVGRWMRRLHVDELPQVLNVLKGDLAIVGPRPEQPHYVAELQATVPFYDARLLIRPGLTGWAQVNYGYGSSIADALEKLQYDFYYMRRQSLRLDLRILGRTVRSVVQAQGL